MAGSSTPFRATAVPTLNAGETLMAFSGSTTSTEGANPSTASIPGTPGNENNKIEGVANVLAGAGTTTVTIRCRRLNGVAGQQVGVSQTVTLPATQSDNIPFCFIDPGAPLNCGYSITINQNGGTAPGTVNEIVGQVSQYI